MRVTRPARSIHQDEALETREHCASLDAAPLPHLLTIGLTHVEPHPTFVEKVSQTKPTESIASVRLLLNVAPGRRFDDVVVGVARLYRR